MPDFGLLQLLIKIQHHAKDVRFAHDAIDFRIRPWTLGRSSWRRIDASLDHLRSFNSPYDAPFAASDSTGNPACDQPRASTRPIWSLAPPKPPCIFETSSNPSCANSCAAICERPPI